LRKRNILKIGICLYLLLVFGGVSYALFQDEFYIKGQITTKDMRPPEVDPSELPMDEEELFHYLFWQNHLNAPEEPTEPEPSEPIEPEEIPPILLEPTEPEEEPETPTEPEQPPEPTEPEAPLEPSEPETPLELSEPTEQEPAE